MHHSYDGSDRVGGLSRMRLLAPLASRDFRLFLGALAVSLVGDGLFLVALAWQVYALSNAPTALATVGLAMTVPTIICLLLGGVISDRVDRRRVMLAADGVRATAMAILALLCATGSLRLWHLYALGALYGAATAFFDPASDALLPEILTEDLLPPANSLDQLVRPVALRMVGPALGGLFVEVIGTGGAFAMDAVSFLISAIALRAIAHRTRPRAEALAVRGDIAAGIRYVRGEPWLWGTLISAAVAYLLFMGPTEVLLPFVVKNRLAGGAGDLGLVFAAGGLGSLLCAVAIGQHGLPRRSLAFMFCAWTLATFAVAGYGLAHALWGLMLASVAFNTLETAGTIAWVTAKQRHVPAHLLGRVSSLDWLVSIGLLPLSFALTGPVSAAIGPQSTLIGAGVLGGLVTASALLIPGVTAPDAAEFDAGPGSGRSDRRPTGQPGVVLVNEPGTSWSRPVASDAASRQR